MMDTFRKNFRKDFGLEKQDVAKYAGTDEQLEARFDDRLAANEFIDDYIQELQESDQFINEGTYWSASKQYGKMIKLGFLDVPKERYNLWSGYIKKNDEWLKFDIDVTKYGKEPPCVKLVKWKEETVHQLNRSTVPCINYEFNQPGKTKWRIHKILEHIQK